LLSIKAIFILNIIILFILSFYILFLLKKTPQKRVLKLLLTFTLSYAIGYIIFILRNQIPDLISIIIANTLFITGSIGLYMMTKEILNLDSKWKIRYIIPIFVIFISFSIFTYIDFNTNMRMIIFNLFIAIYTMRGAFLLKKHALDSYKLFDKVSSILFLLGSIIFILITLLIIEVPINSYYLSNRNIFIYLPNIYMLVLNIWIASVLYYRIKD